MKQEVFYCISPLAHRKGGLFLSTNIGKKSGCLIAFSTLNAKGSTLTPLLSDVDKIILRKLLPYVSKNQKQGYYIPPKVCCELIQYISLTSRLVYNERVCNVKKIDAHCFMKINMADAKTIVEICVRGFNVDLPLRFETFAFLSQEVIYVTSQNIDGELFDYILRRSLDADDVVECRQVCSEFNVACVEEGEAIKVTNKNISCCIEFLTKEMSSAVIHFTYDNERIPFLDELVSKRVKRDAQEEKDIIDLVSLCGVEVLENGSLAYSNSDLDDILEQFESLSIPVFLYSGESVFRVKNQITSKLVGDEIQLEGGFSIDNGAIDIKTARSQLSSGMISFSSSKVGYVTQKDMCIIENANIAKNSISSLFAPIVFSPIEAESQYRDIDFDMLPLSLHNYQKEGVRWLFFLKRLSGGGILADDMGLGKTIQIAAYLFLVHKKEKISSLMVVPFSLLMQWKKELLRFFKSDEITVYHGSGRKYYQNRCVVTTYGVVLEDVELLKNEKYTHLCIDEAHKVKTSSSKIHRALLQLQAEQTICVTGTPFENTIDDVITLLRLSLPLHMMKPLHLVAKTPSSIRFAIFEAFILKRLKKDVLSSLPEKIEQTIYIDQSIEERIAVDNAIDAIQEDTSLLAITKILKIRQVTALPKLFISDYYGDNAKFERVVEDALNATTRGSKVVIFSHFTLFLDALEKQISRYDSIPLFRIDGSTKERDDILNGFSDSKAGSVLLISTRAGGVGLNITAADYVFIYEPWWNNSVEEQAIDRVYRIGQTKDVVARRYILLSTIEEKIEMLQREKEKEKNQMLNENALNTSDKNSVVAYLLDSLKE